MNTYEIENIPFDVLKKEYYKRVNAINKAKPKPETCRGCVFLLSGTKLRERFKIPFKSRHITGHYCAFNIEGMQLSYIEWKRRLFYGLKSKACENKQIKSHETN